MRVFNDRGEMVVEALLNPGIRPGTVAIEHGWKPTEFVKGFYNTLPRSNVFPEESEMNHPVFLWYANAWQNFVDTAPSPGGISVFGMVDTLFDVLVDFEHYKA